MQKGIGCAVPCEGWKEQRSRAELALLDQLANVAQIVGRRKDAVGSDQAVDLHIEREECGEIDQAEDAKEDGAGEEVSSRLVSEEEAVEGVEQVAIRRDQAVGPFAEVCKEGKMLIGAKV